MTKPSISRQHFIVTSPGLSATRWLSFVIASHPDVFVAHGKHPLESVVNGDMGREKKRGDIESLTLGTEMSSFYEKASLEEVFAAYCLIKPGARAYGNVHTYTVETLMKTAGGDEGLAGVNILNVVRHPVSYIASHLSLVRAAENYPVYCHYRDVMFPQALEEYPELFLLECEDYQAFIAFTVSCLSVRNLARDFAYPQFRTVRMEVLTSHVEALRSFCETLTGLEYSGLPLERLIRDGAINRHQKTVSHRNEREIYAGWPSWQQDIAHMIIPAEVIDKMEELGYDVSMLRSGGTKAPASPGNTAPRQTGCLADYVRSVDEHHSLLTLLYRPHERQTELVEEGYHGFNLLSHSGCYYAVDQSLGPLDLNQLDEGALGNLQSKGHVLAGLSLDDVKAQVAQLTPTLAGADFHGFNLVRYKRRWYALAQTLGPVDLPSLDETTLRDYQAVRQCFVGDSMEEVKRHVHDQARQTFSTVSWMKRVKSLIRPR